MAPPEGRTIQTNSPSRASVPRFGTVEERSELKKGNNMDETLRARLYEARERMNNKQVGINTDRRHDDPVMREWA